MQSGILTESSDLESLQRYLKNFTEFSFDTETDGLSFNRRAIGYSLSVKTDEGYRGWYVPIAHEQGDDLFSVAPKNAPRQEAFSLLNQIFMDSGNTIWIHNAKFDLKVLRNEGLDVENFSCEVLDTLCVSWLLEPEREGGHGLKSLVKRILGHEMGSFKQFKSFKNCEVPVGMMGKYAIDDAVYLLKLVGVLYPELTPLNVKVFKELEMPIMRIVEEMEHYGFKIDTSNIKKAGIVMEAKAKEIEDNFKSIFGSDALISSSKWLSNNLCGRIWGVVGLKKGASKQYSTAKDNLLKWKEGEIEGTTDRGREVAEWVLDYRRFSKMVSTYSTKLVLFADDEGRVHGSFNQWGTGTGRMSSSNPNMQNIPSSRTPEGDALRRAFICEEGYKLIVADYSQVELRVTAHLSEDPVMMGIYKDNGDIHQMTADACNCARYNAKEINFGLIYKMGAKTLGNRIKKTQEEAQDYIDRYFEKYAGVAQFQDHLIAGVRRKGFTWTVTGRRRPLPKINSKDKGESNGAERQAINTQVQGSASDIIKIGMRNFHRRVRSEGYTVEDCRIIGQVHDEVVVEAKESIAEYIAKTLQYEMENCVTLKVPLIAEPAIGDSWAEAK